MKVWTKGAHMHPWRKEGRMLRLLHQESGSSVNSQKEKRNKEWWFGEIDFLISKSGITIRETVRIRCYETAGLKGMFLWSKTRLSCGGREKEGTGKAGEEGRDGTWGHVAWHEGMPLKSEEDAACNVPLNMNSMNLQAEEMERTGQKESSMLPVPEKVTDRLVSPKKESPLNQLSFPSHSLIHTNKHLKQT